LEKLIDYARADGADVMLVSESFIYRESMAAEELVLLYREVMSEKTGATTRRNASTGSLARALTAFNSVTRSVAEQRGAIFVDAANMVPKDLAHHMDGVHHTALGARVLANAIADAVIEQGVIARRASPH
jgi:lysophospholipase L1-like esterase